MSDTPQPAIDAAPFIDPALADLFVRVYVREREQGVCSGYAVEDATQAVLAFVRDVYGERVLKRLREQTDAPRP